MKKIASVLAVTVLGLGATGCSHNDPNEEYAEICVNSDTNQRVDDDQCDSVDRDDNDSDNDFMFMWLMMSHMNNHNYNIPAVGSTVSRDLRPISNLPGDGTIYSHVPKNGGLTKDIKSKATKYAAKKLSGTTGSGKKSNSGSKSRFKSGSGSGSGSGSNNKSWTKSGGGSYKGGSSGGGRSGGGRR